MGIVLIIIGVALILFGGGCTLLWGMLFMFDGAGLDLLWPWVILGLGPLVLGFVAIRGGIALRR